MNFIKIKDDYINLDNVNDIRVYEHTISFTFASPYEETFIWYSDEVERPDYNNRKLTTVELEQLKERIREQCNT